MADINLAQARFDFDWKRIERDLDDVGRELLPLAAARFLNNIAIDARDRMKKGLNEDFDRPNNFTKNAFGITWAMAKDGDRMAAQVFIKDKQAEYLAYQVFGGVRGAGDPGSGKWDVFAHAAKLTRYGGVDKGYLKKTAQRNKDEKKQRAALRARRVAARAQRDAGQFGPFQDFSWVTASKNRPGVFFGEVGGLRGYWERPRRAKAARKRQRGVVTTGPKGNNRPKLLVAMKDEVRYRPLFRYDFYVREAIRVKGTLPHWQKAMNHESAKRAAKK